MRHIVALAATLTIGLATAAAADPYQFSDYLKANTSSIDVTKIGGQTAIIAHPKQPTSKVVLYFHGSGENAHTSFNATVAFATLLQNGYTVVSDEAHGLAWGNPKSVQDYRQAIASLRQQGLTDLYVLANSMGGIPALKILRYAHPVAWAGIYPVCNLRSVVGLDAQIHKAYGTSSWAKISKVTPSPLRITGVKGLPMTFWASRGDRKVPRAKNTDLCARQARKAGATVTVHPLTGDHGDLSAFDPKQVAAIFNAATS